MATETPDPRPDLADPLVKEQYFRREFNTFLNLALQVGQITHKTDIEYGSKKVEDILELAGPGYFKQILAHPKTDIKIMYSKLEAAFATRRKSIIKGLDDLSWTVMRGYTIHYGPANDPKFKMIQIPLDVIFANARENLSKLEERLAETEVKIEMVDENTKYELKHHILLLLHLLRMFFIVSIGNDRITLAVMVRNLENELNMVLGERCIPVNADLGDTAAEGGLAGGVGQAFGTITGLMKRIGINPPAGIRPPTESQLSTIITGVFNNPALQQTIQTSMAGLNNTSNSNEVVASIMGNIISGNAIQEIASATTATVDQALSQPANAEPTGNIEDTLKNFVTNISKTADASTAEGLPPLTMSSTAPVTAPTAAVAVAPAQITSTTPTPKITTLTPM